VLRISRALSRALSSRGRPPWTPPAHCVLHLLRGQSSCRGFGKAFGRAFAELRVELRVKLRIDLL